MAESVTTAEPLWTRDLNCLDQEDIWDDSALIDAYDRAVGEVKEAIAKKMNEDSSSKKKKSKPKKTWKVGDFCNAVYSEDGRNYEAYIKEISQSGTNCLVQYIGYGNEEVVPVSVLQPSLGKEAREQQEAHSQKEINAIEAATSNVDSDSVSMELQEKRSSKNKKTKSPGEKSQHSHRKSKKSLTSEQYYMGYPPPTNQPVCFHSVANQSFHATPSHWPGSFQFPNIAQRMPPIPPPPPFPIDQDSVKDEEALSAMLMSWYMSGYHTGFYQGMKQQKHQARCQPCTCIHTQK